MMSGGRKRTGSGGGKPKLFDRLLGIIEGLVSDETRSREETEFFALRVSSIEDRLARLDGDHGALDAARRAHAKLVTDRRAAGFDARSTGVTAAGRLQFPSDASKGQ